MKKTIATLIASAAKHIDRSEAEYLLADILKTDKAHIIARPERMIGFFHYKTFLSYIQKRKEGVPIAYIVGHKNFYGMRFDVNKHTLIPRPETEHIVEAVVDAIEMSQQNYPNKYITLLDIGTGSGCIPVAVMKTLKKTERIFCGASDISQKALKIAKRNAKKHRAAIEIKQGNLLEPWNEHIKKADVLFITANLPYLDAAWHAAEPSIQHEPESALVAEEKGTALYKRLFKQIATVGKEIQLFVEIDPRHVEEMQVMIKKIFPNSTISTIPDLQGHPRILHILAV